MEMRSKLVIALLAAALVLPAMGHAGNVTKEKKPTAPTEKPVYTPPSGCKMLPKINLSDAETRRQKIVSERLGTGKLRETKYIYNKDAAKRHGKQHAGKK